MGYGYLVTAIGGLDKLSLKLGQIGLMRTYLTRVENMIFHTQSLIQSGLYKKPLARKSYLFYLWIHSSHPEVLYYQVILVMTTWFQLSFIWSGYVASVSFKLL